MLNGQDIALCEHLGVLPILKKIDEWGLIGEFDKLLGTRVKQAKYSYSDALIAWMITNYYKGYRLHKIRKTKEELRIIKKLNVPSHDTIGRIMKRFATEPTIISEKNPKNKKDGTKQYTVCDNDQLCELLIVSGIKSKLLRRTEKYTLDIDATTIPNESKDAVMTYKRHTGHTAMVCMIGRCIVYVSLRSGNANAHFRQKECLERCLALLKKHGIKVDKVRIDGAGYKNEILEYLDSIEMKFVVGAPRLGRTFDTAQEFKGWKKAGVNTYNEGYRTMEVASINFNLTKSKRTYRLVGSRIDSKYTTKKESIGIRNGYSWRFLLTNDYELTEPKVIEGYNRRGYEEQNFDRLKKDFGWKKLPFSKLNENLVFMIIAAMIHNVYEGLVSCFAAKPGAIINVGCRLETFKEEFIPGIFGYDSEGKIKESNKDNRIRWLMRYV